MDPISVSYACLILGGAALFWALRRTPFGGLVLLGCGIVFFSSKPLALGVFLAATAITIVGLRTKKTAPAVAALAALLLAFKALDAPWWPKDGIAGVAGLALPLGISYYVLRAIAALIESSRGVLREPKILEAAGFLGFAPILLLGPIERASAFIGQMRGAVGLREIPTYLWGGIGRIAEGLFKVLVLCEVLKRHAEPFASGKTAELAGVDPAGLWTGLCGYSLYLYVNFSGASDLAIGAGRLFGFKIAENFDLPYARPNLSEFWRAWHITLSTWLRDFLFFPIGKRLPRGAAPIVAPLLVMSLCGLWHGLTIPFLLWGLLHGAGLAAHQLWLRARRASAPLDGFAGSIAGRTVGAVVTVHYVAFTWIFFSAGDLGVALANLRGVVGAIPGALDGVAASAIAVAIWSFLPGVRDFLRRAAAAETPTVGSYMASLWRAHVDVILVLIVVSRFLLSRTQPEGAFVYQGF